METKDRPWYEELFESGDYTRFWLGGEEAPRIPAERTQKEVDFAIGALGLLPGEHVLDLCCGYGRHSIELARRGYRVTGIDLSSAQLAMARSAAARDDIDVEWIQADMRAIPSQLTAQVDTVLNMFTAFGYFEDEAENQRVLDGIASVLRPGGRLLIDFINREGTMRRFRFKDWEEIDGALVLRERSFDMATSIQREAMTIVEADGSRHYGALAVRWYTLTELIGMLAKSGLAFRQAWGDFDASDYTIDSRRMIVLAEKAA
jgi:SAM-dependent methyltransferase